MQKQQPGAGSGQTSVGGSSTAAPSSSRYAAPFLRQVAALCVRHWREVLRQRDFTAVRLVIYLFLGVFFGIIWFQIASTLDTQSAVHSAVGVIVSNAAFLAIVTFTSSAPVYALLRPVFYREKAAAYYRPEAYVTALMLTELPVLALMCLMFLAINYPMIGFVWTAPAFFSYAIGIFCIMVNFLWLAQAFILVMPTLQLAQILSGLMFSLQLLFSGLYIPVTSMKGWFWFYYATGISHSARFLTVLQGHCYDPPNCPSITLLSASGPPQRVRVEDYMSSLAGTNYEARWEDLGWLTFISAVFVVALLLTARFIVWQKK